MKNSFIIILLFFCSVSFSQNSNCKNWTKEFDTFPYFGDCKNQESELEFCTLDHLNEFLNNRGYGEYIFHDFDPTKENISIYFELRVDTIGNVSINQYEIEGDFPKDLEEYLVYDIEHLRGWGSAKLNGEKVCSIFDLSLNCYYKPKIYQKCDMMPRFPGCEDLLFSVEERESCAKQKLLEYVYKNLKYPAEKYDRIEGMVVIQFVVDIDGNIEDIKVARSLNKASNQSAFNVVQSFPQWIPGNHNGEKVKVLYTLPVRFKKDDWDR